MKNLWILLVLACGCSLLGEKEQPEDANECQCPKVCKCAFRMPETKE